MAMDSLQKCAANYPPLTPLVFLERAATAFGDRTSIIYGSIRFTWSQTLGRCRRLASALRFSLKIQPGDVVSIVAPNIPAIYEMHFGVPMAGAVLNTLNVRLNAPTMAALLKHAGSKVVFCDDQYLPLINEALQILSKEEPSTTNYQLPTIVRIYDDQYQKTHSQHRYGNRELIEYETLLKHGDPEFPTHSPESEWETISLNYTSGTTSRPKGVVYHHRGAYLNSIVAIQMWGMKDFPVYLWTVPMFHCNGWCFTWAIAAQAGTNICLRQFSGKSTFDAIAKHKVTHLCGAPIILNSLSSARTEDVKRLPSTVHVLTGGAPPPPSILSRMEDMGFEVTHSYGLTETYGPALYCQWKPEWDALVLEQRASLKSRQGLPTLAVVEAAVMNPKTMQRVPRDGKTLGELMIRGAAVMKGYLHDVDATREAFAGGWFHTGDVGVMHPDGYIQLKDRSKDIIISGGENISSIEVESVLYNHPQISEAAVVAKPDEHWGETPCAFVKSNGDVLSSESIIAYCRERLPHYMVPRTVIFGDLPKTSTGKILKHVLREHAKKLGPPRKNANAKALSKL